VPNVGALVLEVRNEVVGPAAAVTKAGWRYVESIWDSQISLFLIHHAGWEGGQHGWASLIF
jgi:hypothetical protein